MVIYALTLQVLLGGYRTYIPTPGYLLHDALSGAKGAVA